jgi:hypothetical protein
MTLFIVAIMLVIGSMPVSASIYRSEYEFLNEPTQVETDLVDLTIEEKKDEITKRYECKRRLTSLRTNTVAKNISKYCAVPHEFYWIWNNHLNNYHSNNTAWIFIYEINDDGTMGETEELIPDVDDVEVTETPLPASILLFMTGFLSILGVRYVRS